MQLNLGVHACEHLSRSTYSAHGGLRPSSPRDLIVLKHNTNIGVQPKWLVRTVWTPCGHTNKQAHAAHTRIGQPTCTVPCRLLLPWPQVHHSAARPARPCCFQPPRSPLSPCARAPPPPSNLDPHLHRENAHTADTSPRTQHAPHSTKRAAVTACAARGSGSWRPAACAPLTR